MAGQGHSCSADDHECVHWLLEHLKKPVRLDFGVSERMYAEDEARKEGGLLWRKVLFEIRRRTKALLAEKERRANPEGYGVECDPKTRFNFMKLPAELRIMIYEYYFEPLLKKSRSLRESRCWKKSRSNWPTQEDEDEMDKYYISPRGIVLGNQSVSRPEHNKILESVHTEIGMEMFRRGHISEAALEAYCRYKNEHYPYCEKDPWLLERPGVLVVSPHGDFGPAPRRLPRPGNPVVVEINSQGSLFLNLPSLAYVNQQIFDEIWVPYLSKDVKFEAWIRNFNFRPLFRLCRMLKRYGQTLTARTLSISLNLFTPFDNMYELFCKHWFEGFPLWDPKIDYSCRRRSIMIELLEWILLVRQGAALYRIDRSTLEGMTWPVIGSFEECGRIEEQGKAAPRSEFFGMQWAEVALLMITKVVRNRLDWESGLSVSPNFPGYTRLGSKEIWKERCAIVESYRLEVGRLLRKRLGASYMDWENLCLDASVPDKGVI